MTNEFATADELLEFLATMGATDSGEAVGFTELDHGLQCAAELAAAHPDDVELQVAGLVHDVAHTMVSDDPVGAAIDRHGEVGAAAVRALLGDRVADLVAAHVPAKRYLVATDPEYGAGLSAVSVASLAEQGGSMTADEATAFEALDGFDDAVELRRADDRAKVVGRVVPGLSAWAPVVRSVAAR